MSTGIGTLTSSLAEELRGYLRAPELGRELQLSRDVSVENVANLRELLSSGRPSFFLGAFQPSGEFKVPGHLKDFFPESFGRSVSRERAQEWLRVLRWMNAANPSAYRDLRVLAGLVPPSVSYSSDFFRRRFGIGEGRHYSDSFGSSPRSFLDVPGAYDPLTHTVIMNVDSTPALVHELGHAEYHAKQMQRAGKDADKYFRSAIRSWIPELWEEYKAWKDGLLSLKRGYAAKLLEEGVKVDEVSDLLSPRSDDFVKLIRDSASVQFPALGTYVGPYMPYAFGAGGYAVGRVSGGLLNRLIARAAVRYDLPPEIMRNAVTVSTTRSVRSFIDRAIGGRGRLGRRLALVLKRSVRKPIRGFYRRGRWLGIPMGLMTGAVANAAAEANPAAQSGLAALLLSKLGDATLEWRVRKHLEDIVRLHENPDALQEIRNRLGDPNYSPLFFDINRSVPTHTLSVRS
ncbi:MAG: hypothetical protein KatS3mg109_0074 [Pirellulaceae bacterium]|nr:MAG: hypothetical protein KatS3mg109_0074 [Pirellulaceae bacterium]